MNWLINKIIVAVLTSGVCACFTACVTHQTVVTESGIATKNFASVVDGRQTGLYILRNSKGLEAAVTNYGARIVSLMIPDKNGHFDDIVCGFDSLADYRKYKQNYGATVGRYIGRILNARFDLDGTMYHLKASGNGHCSHGGSPGFAERVWRVVSANHHSLLLEYVSPDGENGFPGMLTLRLRISLNNNNELSLDYEAETDKPTVLNPSNHSFFNINGNMSQSVVNENLWIDADSIAEYSLDKCVTGRFLSVENTPFDFRTARRIGDRIDEDNVQLKVTGGYDHTWRLNHAGEISRLAATVYDSKSGRSIDVFTTEPGMHIYTANGLKGQPAGKRGIGYPRRSAICFETMHFADSPNKPQFPSTVLRPGEKFHSKTIFRFGIK